MLARQRIKMKNKAKELYFRVDFDGLTKMARDFWAEGEYARALDYLEACNIPLDKGHDIIRGKLKMAQDPNGKDGVDGIIVKDNWTPNLAYCQHSTYPDPNDLPKMAQDALNYKAERRETNLEKLKKYSDELGEFYQKLDWESVGQLWDLIDALAGLEEEKEEIPWSRKLYKEVIENGGKIPVSRTPKEEGLTTVELKSEWQKIIKFQKENNLNNYSEDILGRDNREAPKPTKDFKKYKQGWVMPDGKFYPCLTSMEHIWLADKLGKTEKEAEEAGWIKVSYAMLGIYVGCFRKATQKQLDTLFDWMQGSPERELPFETFIENQKEY